MRTLLKKLVLFACLGALIAGCAREQSVKVASTVDQDFVNAYDAFEMAKNPRAKVASGDTVSMSEGVWLGNKSTVLEHKNKLPSINYKRKMSFKEIKELNVQFHALNFHL